MISMRLVDGRNIQISTEGCKTMGDVKTKICATHGVKYDFTVHRLPITNRVMESEKMKDVLKGCSEFGSSLDYYSENHSLTVVNALNENHRVSLNLHRVESGHHLLRAIREQVLHGDVVTSFAVSWVLDGSERVILRSDCSGLEGSFKLNWKFYIGEIPVVVSPIGHDFTLPVPTSPLQGYEKHREVLTAMHENDAKVVVVRPDGEEITMTFAPDVPFVNALASINGVCDVPVEDYMKFPLRVSLGNVVRDDISAQRSDGKEVLIDKLKREQGSEGKPIEGFRVSLEYGTPVVCTCFGSYPVDDLMDFARSNNVLILSEIDIEQSDVEEGIEQKEGVKTTDRLTINLTINRDKFDKSSLQFVVYPNSQTWNDLIEILKNDHGIDGTQFRFMKGDKQIDNHCTIGSYGTEDFAVWLKPRMSGGASRGVKKHVIKSKIKGGDPFTRTTDMPIYEEGFKSAEAVLKVSKIDIKDFIKKLPTVDLEELHQMMVHGKEQNDIKLQKIAEYHEFGQKLMQMILKAEYAMEHLREVMSMSVIEGFSQTDGRYMHRFKEFLKRLVENSDAML